MDLLEFVKLVVEPVLLERDESGQITGEHVGAKVPIYNEDQMREFMASIRSALEQKESDGGGTE